jgi:2-oxoglutarate ferredoxin oxidoreductase subunit gamma
VEQNRKVRLTGAGGQGIILISIILADAALSEDNFVVQSQSYGPEARGGMCKAEVIVGKEEIDFPKIEQPDILLALSQTSVDNYCNQTREDCLIIADSSLHLPKCKAKTVQIPILETAHHKLNSDITANVIALGAINSLVGIVKHDSLEKAVLKYVPKSAGELNKKALQEGEALAKRMKLCA